MRVGHGAWGVPAIALTALLVSPVSWSHHWVWCVPLLAVLLAEGRWRTAAVVALVFSARTFLLVPHEGWAELQLSWWQQVLASPYPLLALAVLAALAYAAYRHHRRRRTAVGQLAAVRPLPLPQLPASNSSASTMR